MASKDNYMFASEPRAVRNRSKFRPEEKTQEDMGRVRNLMHDKRVVRGSTYAPKRNLIENSIAPLQNETPRADKRNRSGFVPVTREARVATPEPVVGRQHMSVQTDNYLEDLRQKETKKEVATQSNPEFDIPEKPLFEPVSSGVDVFTWIEDGDLFDFDKEVEPILGVITSKSLNHALLQVLEEEEWKEMMEHKSKYAQLKGLKVSDLQRLHAKDVRFENEKERRIAEAALRVEERKLEAKKRAAAAAAKMMFEDLSDKAIKRLAEAGYFHDPVLKQVQSTFLPWLVKDVGSKLKAQSKARDDVDQIITNAASQKRDDLDNFLEGLLRKTVVRAAKRQAIVEKLALEEEEKQQAEFKAQFEAQMKLDLASAGLSDGPPEDPEDGGGDDDGEDDEETAARKAAEAEAEALRKAEEEKRLAKEREEELELLKETNFTSLGVLGMAWEYTEGEAKTRREGIYGPDKPFEMPRGWMNGTVEVVEEVVPEEDYSHTVLGSEMDGELLKKLVPTLGFSCTEFDGDGVFVSSVTTGGGACHASLVAGDVVLSLKGVTLQNEEHVQSVEQTLEAGEMVDMIVSRGIDGREEILTIESHCDTNEYDQNFVRKLRQTLDMTVHDQPIYTKDSATTALKEMQRRLGCKVDFVPNEKTVEVTAVHSAGPVYRAGVKDGDILVKVNGKDLASPDEFSQLVETMIVGDWLRLSIKEEIKNVEIAAHGETAEWVRCLRDMAGLATEILSPSVHVKQEKTESDGKAAEAAEEAMVDSAMNEASAALNALKSSAGFVGTQHLDGEGSPAGVKIGQVSKTGGAVQATLVAGDVVKKMDDEEIKELESFNNLLSQKTVGDVVKVEIIRGIDGRTDLVALEICDANGSMTLSEVRALRTEAGQTVNDADLIDKEAALKILQEFSPKAGCRIDDSEGEGVRVVQVYEGGPAMRAGVAVGDIVLDINGAAITSNDSFVQAVMPNSVGNVLEVKVKRGDEELTLSLELGASVNPDDEKTDRPVEFVRTLRTLAGMAIVGEDGTILPVPTEEEAEAYDLENYDVDQITKIQAVARGKKDRERLAQKKNDATEAVSAEPAESEPAEAPEE